MRRDPTGMGYLSDCELCMSTNSKLHRQSLACGYEPAAPDTVPVQAWKPTGYKEKQPTVCAGYTVKLPEVVEIARARMHWSKGQLDAFYRGECPDVLIMGIETMEGACNDLQMAMYTPESEGGLAKR